MRPTDLMRRAKQYYIRGHTTAGLVITLINTLGIWFGLVPGVSKAFNNSFIAFAAVFVPVYGLMMIGFGYWDMKRGFYRSEQITILRHNPLNQLTYYLLAHTDGVWNDPKILKYLRGFMTNPKYVEEISRRIEELECAR